MNDTLSKSTVIDTFTQQMAANESPSGVINSTPIAGTRSHFRSRTFTSYIGCNPLISAASVLLAFNEQLKELSEHESLEQLHEDLVHEIKAFESNAQERGYIAETILIARYILCAALDETIIYSSLANSSLWQRFKLINTFQNEQSADERFFLIVDRLLNAPTVHIELLELIYTCLSLGFEGKYRYEDKGHLQLSELKDSLFHQIRNVRHDPPKLFKTNDTLNKKSSRVSLWLVALQASIATLILIGLIYGSFAFVFNKVSAPIVEQLKTLLNSQ